MNRQFTKPGEAVVRKTILFAVVAWVALAPAGGVAPVSSTDHPRLHHLASTEQARPNIVLILMDDMRRDDLRWMPAVKRQIFDQGMEYVNYYNSVSLCCPARASILRGQYPHNTGVLTNAEPDGGFASTLRIDSSTLATWLDPTYATGYIGKYFNGYEGPAQTYVPPGWDDWMGTTRTYYYRGIHTNHNGDIKDQSGRNSSFVFAAEARRFIERRAPRERPFFLHLSFVAPHHGTPHTDGDRGLSTPYVVPRDRGRYHGPGRPMNPAYNETDTSDKAGRVASLPPLTAKDRAYIRLSNEQRRESLAAVNREIHSLMRTLRQSGELRRTYLVFTSDNGYPLGEHRISEKPSGGTQHKNNPYEPSTHLPLAIRGPRVPAGQKWQGMAGSHDLAPTILAMADADTTMSLDGHSILPIGDSQEDPSRAILIEKAALPVDAEDGGRIKFARAKSVDDTDWAYHGLVTRRWKLISWDQLGTYELYDLRLDPHELKNVYYRQGYSAVAASLTERLEALSMCRSTACDQ